MTGFILAFFLVIVVSGKSLVDKMAHNAIAFPENSGQRLDSDKDQERLPLYAPSKCPENQLLYPGNQKTDWICDCAPTFIYYPPEDNCYPAYREGPCAKGDHLILPKNKVIPECGKNPCKEGFGKYKGKCYELGKPEGPCRPMIEGGGIFDVNATTLELECLQGTDTFSLLQSNLKCHPGSKREIQNKQTN